MAVSLRLRLLAWLVVSSGALAFLFWAHSARVDRVEFVSTLGLEPLRADPSSATGYAGGARRLIVPGQNHESYQWIEQTQQMFVRREWRVRQIDLENAPEGRPVSATSPYRWVLGTVAWLRHAVSGEPIGMAVEQAALWVEPLLHAAVAVAAAGFVAWRFGWFAAAVTGLGLAFGFPLAANFVPGAPDDHGLALSLAVASVLPLLAGIASQRRSAPAARADGAPACRATHDRVLHRWFVASGVLGGMGLWVSVPVQLPVLIGTGLGGLAAAWALRLPTAVDGSTKELLVLPWRSWAIAGATTTLLAYLLEFAPAHLGGWQVRVVHPLHALGWLGWGGVLTLGSAWLQSRRRPRGATELLAVVGSVFAMAALVIVAQRSEHGGLLGADPAAFRLTRLAGDSAVPNFLRWLVQSGANGQVLQLLSALLLAAPVMWWLLTRRVRALDRALLFVALGPVTIALGLAGWQMSWWATLTALLCGLAAVAIPVTDAGEARWSRWLWVAAASPFLIAGLVRLHSLTAAGDARSLDQAELLGLVHRDLAHWLVKRVPAGEGIVLAPPTETAALAYYAGLRGIGTLSWDNQKGLMATVRIVSATTRQEAEALIARRGVTHVILPSWDTYFREYARVGSGQVEGSFFDELQHLSLPPWLRPVPYAFPTIAGFEDRSVTVLEVVDEQDEATALGRLAAYFVEMGRLDFATGAGQALRRFPAHLGAWVARAEVESACGDAAGLEASLKYLLPRLKAGADRSLPLDRRVGLAVVLSRANHDELAREQVQRCLMRLDEARLRTLSTATVYRLLALAKHHGLEIEDPRLREFGLALLPAELRARVER